MQSCCGPAGKNPRRSSLRRLCVLRLPRKEKPRLSRRQSAPQLLQEALCTASATQRGAAAQPATIRAAAPSGGSVYCVCQAKRSRGPAGDNPRRSSLRRLCVLRLPRKEKPRLSRRQSAPQLLQEALCTASATQRGAAAQPATIRAAAPSGGSVYCVCQAKRSRGPAGDNPRRSSFRRLCVLRLPRKEEPRPSRRQSAPQLLQESLCTASATQRGAAAQPATIRAAAPSGGSVYCVCHAKRSRGPAGDNPRRSSFRRLCVLRLPRKEEPRPSRRQSAPQLLQEALCTASATQRGAAAQPATIRAPSRRLCVLRLPRKEEPRPSRRQSAPQLLHEALCTASATQRGAAAQPATIRAAAPSGGSVYCVCHAKRSRGPAGDNPRSFRRLCVLRLPRTEDRGAQPATIRAAAPSRGSVYCVCHAKRSRGPAGDNPRRSSFRTLCVLRLPRNSEPRPRRRLSAPHLLQAALRTAPATHCL